MTLSGALFNANSGLVAAARGAGAVSQNVANAQTEGYGRRELDLVAASVAGRGTGVRVESVLRDVDARAIADRRLAQGDLGRQQLRADAYQRLESLIGVPGDAGALSDLVTRFESALLVAESRPDSDVRLQNVLFSARDLVAGINRVGDGVQSMRMEADAEIDRQVGILNTTLVEISELNRDIRLQLGAGNSVNGLMDQRQVLVDRLAEIVPIRTYPRDRGAIAIQATGGAVLLDGLPAEFGFTPVGLITTDMTVESGALSGLTLNGKAISSDADTGPMRGGSLAGAFAQRDDILTRAGERADALARDLLRRFDASGLDPSLTASDPGLFTDAGSRFDSADEVGIASRLALNTAADPDAGGALWRLRAGLGASSPGDVGARQLLSGFIGALEAQEVPVSGDFTPVARDFAALTGEIAALNAGARLDAESAETFAQARFQELHRIELEAGVDTDQEMQKLLLIEQAYAANARVIGTVDAMLATILEI